MNRNWIKYEENEDEICEFTGMKLVEKQKDFLVICTNEEYPANWHINKGDIIIKSNNNEGFRVLYSEMLVDYEFMIDYCIKRNNKITEIEVGNVVRLKSGSPNMTVRDIKNDIAKCIMYQDGLFITNEFDICILKNVIDLSLKGEFE